MALGREPMPVGPAGAGLDVQVAGDAAVWPTKTAGDAPVEVHIASPSRSRETILRGAQPARGVDQLPAIAAGPRAIAVSLTDFVPSEETVRVARGSVWAGAGHEPLRRLRIIGRREWAAAVAVSGSTVSVLAARRDDDSTPLRLVFRDIFTGEGRARRLSRHTQPMLAFHGRFIAMATQRGQHDLTKITVRRVRDWRAVSRAVVREDSIDVEMALRRDGALAIAYGRPRYRAALVEPGSRRTNFRLRPSSLAVAFGPRGAVVPRRRPQGQELVELTPGRAARRLTAPIPRLIAFDVRLGRLALRTARCVYVAPLPARDPVEPC